MNNYKNSYLEKKIIGLIPSFIEKNHSNEYLSKVANEPIRNKTKF